MSRLKRWKARNDDVCSHDKMTQKASCQLIPTRELIRCWDKMGLRIEPSWQFPGWKHLTLGWEGRIWGIRIAEKPIIYDNLGYVKHSIRHIDQLVFRFVQLLSRLSFDEFIAFPERGCHGRDGVSEGWLPASPLLHKDYIEFMQRIGVNKRFKGGIRFPLRDAAQVLRVLIQYCFYWNRIRLKNGRVIESISDVMIASATPSYLIMVNHRNCLSVYSPSIKAHNIFVHAVTQCGLYKHQIDAPLDATRIINIGGGTDQSSGKDSISEKEDQEIKELARSLMIQSLQLDKEVVLERITKQQNIIDRANMDIAKKKSQLTGEYLSVALTEPNQQIEIAQQKIDSLNKKIEKIDKQLNSMRRILNFPVQR